MNSATVSLIVRSEMRRRWVSVVAIALLGGLAAGASLAAVAGARRTASAFDRHLDASRAAHMEINPGGFEPASDAQLRRLPGVEEASFWAALKLVIVDVKNGKPVVTAEQPITFASDGRFYDMDRLSVNAGRLPGRDSRDEVAVNRELRAKLGLRLGSTIRLAAFDYDEDEVPFLLPGEPVEAVRVVGEVEYNDDVVVDPIDRVGRLMLSPARLPRGPDAGGRIDYPWYGLRLRDGVSVEQVEKEWNEIAAEHNEPLPPEAGWATNIHSTSAVRDRTERGARPLVTALVVFGGIGLAATAAVLSLSLTRLVRASEEDLRTARTLGVDSRSAFLGGLAPALLAVCGTAVVTAAVATASSAFFPVGPFGRIEPSKGVDADLIVLFTGIGGLVILSLLAATVAVTAQLRSAPIGGSGPPPRPSRLVAVLLRLGFPPSALLGARYAIEPGRGTSAVPTRATLASVVVAVTVLVATTVFGASLGDLAEKPTRFGWSADAMLAYESGYSGQGAASIKAQLQRNPDVTAHRPVAADRVLVNGAYVPALSLGHGAASLAPVLIEGEEPRRAGEVVLGTETLAEVNGRVGGTVQLGPDKSTARVTGLAVFPVIGPAVAAHTGLGQGAWLHLDSWGQLTDIPSFSPTPIFNFVLLRARPGTEVSELNRALSGARASAEGQGLDIVVGVLRPAEVDTAVSLGTGQVVMAGLVTTVAVFALALTLIAVVRRRGRDLALHRVLGFTPRQAGAASVWQALVTVVIALGIGVPVGVALGRWLWIGFADQINVVTSPSTPPLLLGALVLGLIAVAVIVSLVPAAIAARARPAILLRTE